MKDKTGHVLVQNIDILKLNSYLFFLFCFFPTVKSGFLCGMSDWELDDLPVQTVSFLKRA